MSEGAQRGQAAARESLPERVTLLVSVLVVLSLMGYIAWHGLVVADGPPAVAARVLREKARGTGGHWSVPIEVRNTSAVPLEEVNVTVALTTRDGERVERTLTFGYLAEREREEAFVVSDIEPAAAQIEARVESFKAPNQGKGY